MLISHIDMKNWVMYKTTDKREINYINNFLFVVF